MMQHSTARTAPQPLGTAAREPGQKLRWSFYAFVASLPFETVSLGVPVELTSICGGLLVLMALLEARTALRCPSSAFWCFALFVYVSVCLAALFGGEHSERAARKVLILAQLLVLFWISSNLLRHRRVAREATLALGLSCVVLSLLQMAGVTRSVHGVAAAGSERISALGQDANNMAAILMLGILALVAVFLGREHVRSGLRWAAGAGVALVAVALVWTGSRGGLLALSVGLLVFALAEPSLKLRARKTVLVVLALGAVIGAAYQSEAVRSRFEKAVVEGTLSKRELIYPLAWDMVQEKPWTGWAPAAAAYELGSRLKQPGYDRREPHNLVLYVLTNTGVMGAIPFLLGTVLCVRAAWRGRRGPHGVLPLAMLVAVLVSAMSVDGVEWKQHWLVMAFAVASGGRMVAAVRYPHPRARWKMRARPQTLPASAA